MNTTRKVVRELKPKVRQLADLMLAKGDASGGLDYAALTAENPEWEASYPSRKWVVANATRLRKSGRFAFEKEQAQGLGVPAQANETGKELSPILQTVLQLAQEFTDEEGKMNWKAAFEAHPEAKNVLVYKNSKSPMQKAYQLLNDLRKRGVLPANTTPGSARAKASWAMRRAAGLNGNGHAPQATAEELAAAQETMIQRRIAAGVAEGVNQILANAGYCPRCALHLLPQLRAAAFAVNQ